jgi:hypothetical protein
MVQAKLNPIANLREQLCVLRTTAKFASTNQGNEEHDKQPHDTTMTK